MDSQERLEITEPIRVDRNRSAIIRYAREHTFGVHDNGTEYEIGPFTRAFVDKFQSIFNADVVLDRFDSSAFEETIRIQSGKLKLHYTILFGETLDANPELDISRILDATELRTSVVESISRISAAFVLSYMRYNPKVKLENALLAGHLFAVFLREEVRSGNNRNYTALPVPPGIRGHTDWWPEFSRFRLFIKARLIAEKGLELYKLNRRFARGKTLRAPRWVMKRMES